jgi:ABC-type glycerol-3-phosphate transport system substrate-binding protein
MRKFVLAAAIATSALGLAACSETADQADDTVDAMAADAEAEMDGEGE